MKMTLRTKIAWAMTVFMFVLLSTLVGATWFVARHEIVGARYDVLRQAMNLLEEDVRNRDAVLSLHEDSVVLERQEGGSWVVTGGEVPAGTTFPINYDDPALIDDWFVMATTNGLAFGFRDEAVSGTLRTLATVLFAMFVIAVLLTFIGTWWILRRGLHPLRKLHDTMERITKSGKLETLEVEARHDEITTLSHGFNHMIARVEETMAQQRRFVADVSHELKTPLTVIEGYARLLERWGQTDPAVRDEAIDHILSESKRMRESLIEPMLELNRLSSVEMEQEAIDLKELGRQLADRFDHAHGKRIPIEAEGEWWGHRESLQRVLTIFIDNSLKYATETEVFMTPHEIQVRDRGPVLDEDQRRKVFHRFYRLDEARDRSGSGLGLSIAEEVAQVNGWTVGCKPNVPDGSIFYVIR